MICVIALVVFGILGIFSARYRIIAKEALDCVFRRVTFRKCTTGLDKRLKAQITGKLMAKHHGTGRFIYKNFEIISWFFLLLLFTSLFFTAQGAYLFAKYGNCNGPDGTKFCIFDPLNTFGGGSEEEVGAVCMPPDAQTTTELSFKGSIENRPFLGSDDAKTTIVEFGCFSCPNTKDAAPEVKKLLDEYGDEIKFVYLDFPLANHDYAREAAIAAACVWKDQPENYWDYHFKLFETDAELSEELLVSLASRTNIQMNTFLKCLSRNETTDLVDEDYQAGIKSGVYGTPTFFINEEPYVGVKTFKELKKLI